MGQTASTGNNGSPNTSPSSSPLPSPRPSTPEGDSHRTPRTPRAGIDATSKKDMKAVDTPSTPSTGMRASIQQRLQLPNLPTLPRPGGPKSDAPPTLKDEDFAGLQVSLVVIMCPHRYSAVILYSFNYSCLRSYWIQFCSTESLKNRPSGSEDAPWALRANGYRSYWCDRQEQVLSWSWVDWDGQS